MAAVTAQTVTEKRVPASAVQRTSPIYTRTVTFPLVNGETAGAANLTGFKIPANTLVLGGAVKFSVDQGATATFKFSVTDGSTPLDFCAAHAYNNIINNGLKTPVAVATRAAEEQVTYTTASAAVTGAVVTLTLILCPIGVTDSITTITA